MSGHCKGCGVFQEEDDSRLCTACESEKKVRLCKHDLEVSPSGELALCRKCPFVGVWRDGMWERAGDGAARVQVTQWLRDNERQSKSLGLLDQAAGTVLRRVQTEMVAFWLEDTMTPFKREIDFSGPVPVMAEDGTPPTIYENELWAQNKRVFALLYRYGKDYRLPQDEDELASAWVREALRGELFQVFYRIKDSEVWLLPYVMRYIMNVLPPGSWGKDDLVTRWSLGR